jgi:formyltetrahydrofolate deformylase
MLHKFILQLRCPDRPGILARIAPYFTSKGCDIREAGVYGDPDTSTFFVRMVLAHADEDISLHLPEFGQMADELELNWSMHKASQPLRVLIAVSKFDHCLNDLLYKWRIGSLPIDIVGIVSNHETLRRTAEWHGLEFYYLPVSKENKLAQEERLYALFCDLNADCLVLARYMQILSDGLATRLAGRCINIHHSFLPSFKGAKPYHQAHDRGVKIIGATAHFVTPDLDEGPIIEQDVRRVTHATTAEEMVVLGQEVEASVLSRAVKWQAERRIFLNGARTVVI